MRRCYQHPPAGISFDAQQLRQITSLVDPEAQLRQTLSEELDGAEICLLASGREALRQSFLQLRNATGRNEVIVAAYTCYSVPAAAIAAGLRVRLIDCDSRGRLDSALLCDAWLEDAAALVVSNLFGIPEEVGRLRNRCAKAGCALIDDAAQSFGAWNHEGKVGARGDYGILSFGRGKPLGAMGGGALVHRNKTTEDTAIQIDAWSRWKARLRATLFNFALQPRIFPWLAAIPALEVGITHFDPDFRQGAMDPQAIACVAALLNKFEANRELRLQRALRWAEALAGVSGLHPLLASPAEAGAYPRLAVLADDLQLRDAALRCFRSSGVGVAPLYPQALDRVDPLKPYLVASGTYPVAKDLAERLLTLSTSSELPSPSVIAQLSRLRNRYV